jgi:aminoglycoside 3-N-acetyltransferase
MNDRLRNILVRYTPQWLLVFARERKKSIRRNQLRQQQQSGGWSYDSLREQFIKAGIVEGDHLLVHSSLSKIGYVQGGPHTVIQALLNVLGPQGDLLMPSFPAAGRNKDYLDQQPVFDVRITPSAMGSITETFRKMPGVKRSLHPTDPVLAYGPLTDYFTTGHLGQLTPYNEHSPFRRLAEKKGKILMLGTTLNGAGTSLHTLEDAVDFPYPVYLEKTYEVTVIDEDGISHQVKTKVHNPEMSAKRNCDALKPLFIRNGIMKECKIGEAACLLIDAEGMFQVMLKAFRENGVTMYTPYGTSKKP